MTPPTNLSASVRECAVRISESGAAALAGLYDLTATRLVRYAVTITRNQHDAEDSVQAALVHVVKNPAALYQAEAPWPYLLRMVRNEALVVLRRKKRWSLANNLSDLLTWRSVDELEMEDTYRAVWLALRKLPVEQSEVIVLKIWEGFTFAQIAGILEMPLASVSSRYRYGLQKLAGSLGSFENDSVGVSND